MIVFGKRSDILEIVSHKPDIVTTPQQWSQWAQSRLAAMQRVVFTLNTM